ncbi:MAG: ATP citrate lyase citrate-binding domain-containing protein, partial [Candidatus Dojkabacteria bacterium]
ALKKYEMELRGQEVQVFVRRGGPNEKAGLEAIEGYLKDSGLLGKVSGSEDMLTEPINLALERINRKD